MKQLIFFLFLLLLATVSEVRAQSSFAYNVELAPVVVSNLPGLHSFAFGQHDGKWLIIGGRTDGLHARQPFNAFPGAQNNTDIYVIDVSGQQWWSSSLNVLPTSISEQLQSTNMNFHQDGDTLVIVGGYSYSASLGDHKTFSNLTTVQVSSVVDAVISGGSVLPYFKQISDSTFAVTGGQLNKLEDTYYLVGGQKFDGRYNPMGHPTYTQAYTNQVRKFVLDNSGSQLSFLGSGTYTDPVHLRRRDYNLLPQIFPNGSMGFTISSGVFQLGADLPYLYPVDIDGTSYNPVPSFNQYLSNYHSAHVSLFDGNADAMHNLFFGGMSQYYYQNGSLIQDDNVPFVKTISRLTRDSTGVLEEFQLSVEMPGLKGASSEFIPNLALSHTTHGVIDLSSINADTILIGYIYGGIHSNSLNPFSMNQSSTTSADASIFEVRLIADPTASVNGIDGSNPYSMSVFPNPSSGSISVEFGLEPPINSLYYLTTVDGRIVDEGMVMDNYSDRRLELEFNSEGMQALFLTVVIEDTFYLTETILLR